MKKLVFDHDRVAEARALRERWYLGEKPERIPYMYTVTPTEGNKKYRVAPGNPYSYKEMCLDSGKAVEGIVASMQYQFDTFPDCDYLPLMPLSYLGEGILAAMYGAEQYIVENNPPFTKGRLFKDIYDAERISNNFIIEETEWGNILKEHIERFVDATGGQVPVGMPDYQSPYGTATKLVPNEDLMMAMYDEPELVHKLLGTVTEGIIMLVDAVERWVGSELVAHNFRSPIPGKCGFTLWDDYISVLTPGLHKEFCVPYNRKLFDRYGYGHLHTCGPYFPKYIDACLACTPRSMDTSIMRGMGKSKEDLLTFLDITSSRNIRLFGSLSTNGESIFGDGLLAADEELIEIFIRGGYMPSGGGTYEQGIKFREMIARLKSCVILSTQKAQ